MRTSSNSNFYRKFKLCPVCLKSTFDSTTNHLNLSPMFQNFLLLDLTVIDLMSIVQLHMDELWVEIANNFEMRTSGGRGSTVISDTPGRGGGGGSKKGKFLRTSFMDGPKLNWSRDHPFSFCGVLGSKWDRILLGVRVMVRVMG